MNRKGLNVYLLFDPANEKKRRTIIPAAGSSASAPTRKIRILNFVRDRLNLSQRTRLVMHWHRTYKPIRQDGTRYEHYGMQADIEHIRGVMATENYDFDITPVGGQTPKNDRIRRLIPYFEQGRILLPRTLHYTDYTGKTRDLVHDFVEEEFKPFPVPVHDDMLDSLAACWSLTCRSSGRS